MLTQVEANRVGEICVNISRVTYEISSGNTESHRSITVVIRAINSVGDKFSRIVDWASVCMVRPFASTDRLTSDKRSSTCIRSKRSDTSIIRKFSLGAWDQRSRNSRKIRSGFQNGKSSANLAAASFSFL